MTVLMSHDLQYILATNTVSACAFNESTAAPRTGLRYRPSSRASRDVQCNLLKAVIVHAHYRHLPP